jgi:hypothetical protein
LSRSFTKSASKSGLGGNCFCFTISRPFTIGAFNPGHTMLERPEGMIENTDHFLKELQQS